jgi:type IV pilus assembly protein PilQ
VNLGNVTPNFYFSLKALESRGIIKLRSTPQIATLNGNEAKLSVGQQQYYLEVSNNVIGAQNPQNIISQNYKSVNADLAITVNPSVSGDEQITLEINVKQSSFTERINPSAPPGTITRDFKSMIRVKNQEMIVLGGLEENSLNDTGSGLPLLYRIPVLKWLFGNRTKSKSNNKLTIFVRPTVLY